MLRTVYLNNMNGLIDAENIGEGTVTEVVAYPHKIVEVALRSKASSVIIAHNHPEDLPRPSRSDDILTQKIKLALDTVNIPLQEHLIIAPEGYYGYK